ncbi:MAG: peptidase M4, partial [Acidobacteria bacterium]
AWSGGGFLFSVLDIHAVRGEDASRGVVGRPLDGAILRTAGLATAEESGAPASATLIDRGAGPRWELRDSAGGLLAVLDARTGAPAGLLDADRAARIAAADFRKPPAVASVELVETDPPLEYRGRPLPAWRVAFADARRTHVYVDARTGAIAARRNRLWRVFDFFWMLHTMDYRGRDDFNNPLLTAFSVLALATSAAGIALWGWRLAAHRRSRAHGRRALA